MKQLDLVGIGMTSQRTRDRLVQRLVDQGIGDTDVLTAIGSVPRHIFVDEALAQRAYEDTALPIGHGQTISQPFVVALMTQTLLDVHRARILEVGSGSGYQTAILAQQPGVDKVFAIERLAPLVELAEQRLRALQCRNVRFRHGDGYQGWPGEAPYDGILVAAAPRRVPAPLLEQLAVGGRLVVPVGDGERQELKVYDRTPGGFETSILDYVRFVPLKKGTR